MKSIPELVQREAMMLRADGRDLDRAHQRSDPSCRFPVDAALEPEYEARAISVPAAGRVDHGRCADCGNLDAASTGVYRRPFGAARYYIGRDTRRKFPGRESRALLEERGLVVVDRHPRRLLDESCQFLAAE